MKDSITGKFNKTQGVLGKKRQAIALGSLALVVVIVLIASYGIIQITEQRAHASAEKLVSTVVDHIDAKMQEVKNATREAAHVAYEELDDPEALEELVREFVENNDFVYGSTVAFEPDYFPEYGRSFAPYSWVTSDGKVHSRQLGTETDYYEEEWYLETKLSGEEYWCEPYFDEGGAKIMMCTFSIPLKDDNGDLVAVMTADVGLEDLEEYVSSIAPNEDSFIVLRSKKGIILANADHEANIGNNTIVIRGMAEIGWSVELVVPFTYLMRGDTGIFLIIGFILLIALGSVYFINRMLLNLQQRSSAAYLNVIDAVSSSFTSIYLVDLNSDETIVFRDPENYTSLLGTLNATDNGFNARLTKLIDYDGFPADRVRMRSEVKLETIRKKLSQQDRYEVRFRKEHDNEAVWYEMHVFAMERDSSGNPLRAVIAFADVNDSVQREKEIQETLEEALMSAQTANKAKTDFLFNMSHDIRTPMNAIIGFTNMAKKHIDDKDKVIDCLDKTQQSGNLLLALINSVLDVSRIESGHAKVEESPADITYSFAAIQDTLTELAASSDIDISFEIGDITDRYVYCDLDRCNRIFVNIISNSIKYTHAGGRVRVRCEQVESDTEGYGKYKYTFEDNGIGMSEEFQKNVFEQFTRERSSTVSGIQGSGLGLAVCKSFVDLMGGTISCKSKPNEGTTFTVILPFRLQEGKNYIDPYTREEVNAADEKEAVGGVSLAGRKVLLVEDNELNLEIAEEILKDAGLIVEIAKDGSVAVDVMKNRGPDYFDFVLMDIQMPVMNGYEATKAIRKMYPDSRLPIIAVSANAFEEDKQASKDAGMDEHVAKPINVGELFNVLARYL